MRGEVRGEERWEQNRRRNKETSGKKSFLHHLLLHYHFLYGELTKPGLCLSGCYHVLLATVSSCQLLRGK